MSIHISNVKEPWFSLIKIGKKKAEGRLNKGSFSKMQKGDYIIFKNNELNLDRECKVIITDIIKYKTFEEYLINEKIKKCLPGIDTLEEAVSVYRGFYSKSDEEKFNILAIKIKVIKK